MNLWTASYADACLTAQAQSPTDKSRKTPSVSCALTTARRLTTSFKAPQEGLNLILGKVKSSADNQPQLILPGTCPNDRHHRRSKPRRSRTNKRVLSHHGKTGLGAGDVKKLSSAPPPRQFI